ncbi:transposase [Alkalibacillus flavidus]|uniref:Transposase n=1 Tax=Alkalibacillus flavidus TaxID=546021 RepID=A0ABV2KVY7_9BACI
MTKRQRRSFSKEFKEQLVQLYTSGKPRADIIKEYELTSSTFDRWVKQYRDSVSFEEKDKRRGTNSPPRPPNCFTQTY